MSLSRGLLAITLLTAPLSAADEIPPNEQFLHFIRQQAVALRANDRPPATKEEWLKQRETIRERLEAAWGGFPTDPCPLEPKKLGELQRDGYRLEKLLLQTMPGIWMTALAYVPDTPGKHPAILQVHGHWKGAKQDPVLQRRCIGAAKHGFFVLAVDAFGAGERGLGKALGEYHGDMVGATLLPTGRPLSAIQVYENMRAVDYLQSRPEVEATKIGITGASGGGNQTMYAGAWDERFGSVIPVCSVGNYQSYLGIACCMCEVVPGALTFTEESGILGLTAPRGLMVVNNSKDGIQFSIREARKSIVGAQYVYDLFGQPDRLYHSTFRWQHDYHQPIREAMYGFMTQQLKGEGDGSPVAEIPFETFDPEEIRCFPNNTRPDDWVTLPQFAAAEGRKVLAKWKPPASTDEVREWREAATERLVKNVFGGFPLRERQLTAHEQTTQKGPWTIRFSPEPGLTLTAEKQLADGKSIGEAILLNLDGADAARRSPLNAQLRQMGWDVITLELRATGTLSPKGERVGRAPDHNSAEWSMWIGRPLLGQWTFDVSRLLDVLDDRWDGMSSEELAKRAEPPARFIVGEGPAGLVALCVGATHQPRLHGVSVVNMLASYVTDVPYEGQRLGTLAPGILREVGDVPHLVVLAGSPTILVIAGGVKSNGQSLTLAELEANYAIARECDALLGRRDWPINIRPKF